MYQVLSSTVFSFVSYMHIQTPLRMYWPRLFFVVFKEIQCLYNFNHDDVRHITELYLSVSCLFRAAVSEMHDLNQNKKRVKNNNLENGYF